MTQNDAARCPHCGEPMKKWRPPVDSTWTDDFHYVCFNDDCAYYKKGWEHMNATCGINCSYRYMRGQHGRQTGPLPVPSPKAGRDQIIEETDD